MTETYTYDAFGTLTYIQSLNEDGVLAQADTALSRFLYAGEQYDEVSGLYYLRARRYDTTVGRFTQEDTYLGDGRNLYVYVGNNPLKYIDPSGHDKKHERIGDGLFNFASGISMAVTGTAAAIVATTLALTATVLGGPVLAVAGTVVMVATAAMGAGMAVMGVSDATQGAMEVYNAVTGNPDPAPNLIRDTVFGGNQEAYIQAEAMLSFGTTVGLTAIAALPLVITTSASGAISYYAHLNTSGSGSGTSGTYNSWYNPDGSINYPPNNGAVSGTEVSVTLKPGDTLGRYGNIGEKSSFVTQAGADASKLALPPNTDPAIYQEFEVIKEIPGTIQAEIAPWGGSAGGGLQYELPMPILQLIKEGYIVPK